MSIWCSIDDGVTEYDLVPVDRDNYTGEPEAGGSVYFIDVATNHGFNDCTRLVLRRYSTGALEAGFTVLLTPQEVARLIARLTVARDEYAS